jgi:hypothetical protein
MVEQSDEFIESQRVHPFIIELKVADPGVDKQSIEWHALKIAAGEDDCEGGCAGSMWLV